MDCVSRALTGLFVGVALCGAATGCSQAKVGKRGVLLVSIGSEESVECGGTIKFEGKAGQKHVQLWNGGELDLTIKSVRLADGGNAYISLKPDNPVPKPVVLRPYKSDTPDKVEFDIVYAPGSPPDTRKSTLVMESTYQDFPECRIDILPTTLAPKIVVNPDNVKFLNSGSQDIKITNAGNQVLVLDGVSLLEVGDEFQIFNAPKKGTEIFPQGSGLGREEWVFKVIYVPGDPPDENVIVVKSNDPSTPDYRVRVEGVVQYGTVQVSYADQLTTGCVDFMAFTEQGTSCSKVVNIQNVSQQGQVLVNQPRLEPESEDVNAAYKVSWYETPITVDTDEQGCVTSVTGTEIQQAEKALKPGGSVAVVVTYMPPGAVGLNATLVIPYQNPGQRQAKVYLCGGMAKGELAVVPGKSNLFLFALPGETQEKHVIVANKGNGTLTINGVEIKKAYDVDPDAFQVDAGVSFPYSIPKWGLLPITVKFTTDYEQPVVNAYLDILYVDPTTSSGMTYTVNMLGRKDFVGLTLPQAQIAVQGTPKVGEELVLDGSKSTAGSSESEEFHLEGYRWFLLAKPQNSSLLVDEIGGTDYSTLSVTPDAPGKYTFGLVVFSSKGEGSDKVYLYSGEATIDVQAEQ